MIGPPAPDDAAPDDAEHYFTAAPGSSSRRTEIAVRLRGAPVRVVTAPGVFSRDGLDLGTRVLLRSVPAPANRGDLLDLGCGWGPIALALAMACPDATVWAVDVNERARELTAENAARLGLGSVRAVAPAGVPADVRFEAIWSNPPIRIGKPAVQSLLLEWLPRLALGGQALLVVQRNLGADSLHRWLAGALGPEYAVRRRASAKGFRVLEVARGDGGSGEPTPTTP